MSPIQIAIIAATLAFTACGPRAGNIKSAKDYKPLPAPAVANPYYDPFATVGSADAVWTPRVWDKSGTLVNPSPRGSAPGFRPPLRPPGTF